MKAGGSAYPATHESIDNQEHYVYQEGRAVYKHAVSDMLEVSQSIMRKNDLDLNTIDWFVPATGKCSDYRSYCRPDGDCPRKGDDEY